MMQRRPTGARRDAAGAARRRRRRAGGGEAGRDGGTRCQLVRRRWSDCLQGRKRVTDETKEMMRRALREGRRGRINKDIKSCGEEPGQTASVRQEFTAALWSQPVVRFG